MMNEQKREQGNNQETYSPKHGGGMVYASMPLEQQMEKGNDPQVEQEGQMESFNHPLDAKQQEKEDKEVAKNAKKQAKEDKKLAKSTKQQAKEDKKLAKSTKKQAKEDKKLAKIARKQAKEDRKLARSAKKQENNPSETNPIHDGAKKTEKPKQTHGGTVSGMKVCLSALGCIAIPYLFILLMGLLESMQIFQVNVYIIIGCSLVFCLLMIIYTFKLASKRKKQV